jgi:hypothetical protein
MDENYRTKNFGIAPRAISYLFQRLREKTQETNYPYYIRVSYCEIYNEQVEIFQRIVFYKRNFFLFRFVI